MKAIIKIVEKYFGDKQVTIKGRPLTAEEASRATGGLPLLFLQAQKIQQGLNWPDEWVCATVVEDENGLFGYSVKFKDAEETDFGFSLSLLQKAISIAEKLSPEGEIDLATLLEPHDMTISQILNDLTLGQKTQTSPEQEAVTQELFTYEDKNPSGISNRSMGDLKYFIEKQKETEESNDRRENIQTTSEPENDTANQRRLK